MARNFNFLQIMEKFTTRQKTLIFDALLDKARSYEREKSKYKKNDVTYQALDTFQKELETMLNQINK